MYYLSTGGWFTTVQSWVSTFTLMLTLMNTFFKIKITFKAIAIAINTLLEEHHAPEISQVKNCTSLYFWTFLFWSCLYPNFLIFCVIHLLCCRNEYLIFQKIIKLEYEFPERFFPKAKDLVTQLLVGHKNKNKNMPKIYVMWTVPQGGTLSHAMFSYLLKIFLIPVGKCNIICFPSVTGFLQAYRLWGDGRVWPFEAAPLLRHHLLEWPPPTDASQAHPLPASHVWRWRGLLWQCEIFSYLILLICSLLVAQSYIILTSFFCNFSMTTSWASSAACRWPSPAHHTPYHHRNPHPRKGPAATLSSTSMTWTTTPLSWTFSSLKKRSSCCWISRPLETPGEHRSKCFTSVSHKSVVRNCLNKQSKKKWWEWNQEMSVVICCCLFTQAPVCWE